MPKLSILKWQPILWINLSHKWAEVLDISKEDFIKLQSKTHRYDVENRELVEIPQPEPEPIPEPTEKEIKEAKLQEIEKLLLRKQALELLWEDLDDTIVNIQETADEILDLGEWTKAEKTARKNSVEEKLLVNK